MQRAKFFPMYQDIALRVAQESHAKRKQVGCVIVSPTGMIAIGYNGMPSGYPNRCELPDGTTDPLVTHAERNAIDKMARTGNPLTGSIVFITLSPCLECAKSLAAMQVSAVYYRTLYKCSSGLDHLTAMEIPHSQWSE